MWRERRGCYRRKLHNIMATAANLDPPIYESCNICDISQTGAQLAFGLDVLVPDSFTLWLSADGLTSRKCAVVWRRDNGTIGVRFVHDEGILPVRMPYAI